MNGVERTVKSVCSNKIHLCPNVISNTLMKVKLFNFSSEIPKQTVHWPGATVSIHSMSLCPNDLIFYSALELQYLSDYDYDLSANIESA